MVNKTSAGCRACERDEEEAVAECIAGRRTVVRRCHLGLIDLYVPIVMGDRIEGLFCAGQFFACRPSEETFRKVAGKLKSFGIKLPEARRAYFTAPVIEKKRVAAVIDLLEMVVGLVDARRLQTLQSAVAHDPLRRALDYIEAHYAEPLRITLAASEAGLSASRLAHVFKSQMGMSFTAYMNLVRVSWAKCFLANSSQRVSETAFRVGFGNLSHFNHVFRRLTGLAPRQFQQQSGTRK